MGRIPLAKTNKSVRVSVLLAPKTKENIKKIAVVRQKSFNSLVNQILEDYVTAHANDVARYEGFYGEDIE